MASPRKLDPGEWSLRGPSWTMASTAAARVRRSPAPSARTSTVGEATTVRAVSAVADCPRMWAIAAAAGP